VALQLHLRLLLGLAVLAQRLLFLGGALLTLAAGEV
jgi:hypothetical protein